MSKIELKREVRALERLLFVLKQERSFFLVFALVTVSACIAFLASELAAEVTEKLVGASVGSVLSGKSFLEYFKLQRTIAALLGFRAMCRRSHGGPLPVATQAKAELDQLKNSVWRIVEAAATRKL